MKIYTFGYGGRKPEDFLNILSAAGIRTVVDVRLRPDRASLGVFVKAKTPDKGIVRLLAGRDIAYCSLVELGNVFLDLPEWRALYAELLRHAGELLTGRIGLVQGPVCLLCAEKCVDHCHRQQIAEFLASQGHEIVHL